MKLFFETFFRTKRKKTLNFRPRLEEQTKTHLDEEAQHRDHGEAPVLDLLDLELGKLVGVVGEAERVEAGARVEPVEVLVLEPGGPPGDAVVLHGAHEDDLDDDRRDDVLRVL